MATSVLHPRHTKWQRSLQVAGKTKSMDRVVGHADKARVVVRCKAQGTVPLFIAGQGHAQDDV